MKVARRRRKSLKRGEGLRIRRMAVFQRRTRKKLRRVRRKLVSIGAMPFSSLGRKRQPRVKRSRF